MGEKLIWQYGSALEAHEVTKDFDNFYSGCSLAIWQRSWSSWGYGIPHWREASPLTPGDRCWYGAGMVARKVNPLTTLEKIKVRNLYLFQNTSHTEIAQVMGKTTAQISQYVFRAGLTKAKRERDKKLITQSDAKVETALTAGMEAIVDECEELALSGLKRAKESVISIHKDAAKDFQAWTAGIRNVVTARNLARSGAVNTLGNDNQDTRNVALFFLSGGTVERTEKVVTADVVDVPRGTKAEVDVGDV